MAADVAERVAVSATLQSLDMKQMGVGLAVAVLIDATLIRAVLLPASIYALSVQPAYRAARCSTVSAYRRTPILGAPPARSTAVGPAL